MKLHKIKEAMRNGPLKVRGLALKLGIPYGEADTLLEPESDITLSTLYTVQQALGVPMAELLVMDHEPMESPIKERAALVRIMKGVRLLKELDATGNQRTVIGNIESQLIELMPELATVAGWPKGGQHLGAHDTSAREERTVPDPPDSRNSGDWWE